MYRSLTLLSILLLLPVFLFSQVQQDVVFLKNGSILKGIIKENTDSVLKIETCCGNLFAFQKNEILKVETETVPENKHILLSPAHLEGLFHS